MIGLSSCSINKTSLPYIGRSVNIVSIKRIFLLLSFFTLFGSVTLKAGIPITPETIALASQSAPVAMAALKEVAALPAHAVDVLYLPRGVIRTALGVLPGPRMVDGLRDVGKGLTATGNLVAQTIKLPFNILNRVSGASRSSRGRR